MSRLLLIATAISAIASCNVNEYCLNCERLGDGGPIDTSPDDGGIDSNIDAPDGGPCIVTGVEVCDGKDNDCNGSTDDGTLPDVGVACANQMGECSGSVKQCVMGALVCDKPPMPETCDLKDNNCNGMTDEGDPGGGAACGTNVGECTAGVKHCNPATGMVECYGAIGTVGGQAEMCNGRDDDCDASFDESITLGTCGGPNVGTCHTGTMMCVGGGPSCQGDQGPTFEACDNMDNDCDTRTDEDYNKLTDPQNCMTCGNVCSAPHAISGCAGGACTIASCQTGYHNNNGSIGDGCEYGPCQQNGAEVCDGIDNDCDGSIDNGLTAPMGLCKTVGACAGATAQCMGASGWRCNYNGNVSTDGMGNVIAETRCDNIDNDCDTKTDENQPNKGQACSDAGIGVCRGTGTFVCNGANLNGPAVCNITMPGMASSPERCDGLDNDCNGAIDNGAATGNLVGQDWISMGNGREIMKYEASRPDASATSSGVSTATTCSRTGAVPWTNVTYPQAVAACTAIGARLCTEGEWHRSCSVIPSTTYPIAVPAGTQNITVEAEDYFAIAARADTAPNPDVVHSWVPDTTAGHFGVSDMQAQPNSGSNINTAARAITDSARLDYRFNFAVAGNYRVCVRTYSSFATGNPNLNDRFWSGISPNAPGVAANLRSLQTPVDNAWTWTGPTSTIAVAAGLNTLSIYMELDGLRIDQVFLTTANACPANSNPPAGSAGNKWAYQNAPNTFQPGVCNSDEMDADIPPADAGNQDDALPTGTLSACFANGTGALDIYDMSGNVKEWTAARQPGQNPIRGGSSNNTADGISCPLNFTLADDTFFFPNVGFRCCR